MGGFGLIYTPTAPVTRAFIVGIFVRKLAKPTVCIALPGAPRNGLTSLILILILWWIGFRRETVESAGELAGIWVHELHGPVRDDVCADGNPVEKID